MYLLIVQSSWSSKWASPPNSGKNACATTPVILFFSRLNYFLIWVDLQCFLPPGQLFSNLLQRFLPPGPSKLSSSPWAPVSNLIQRLWSSVWCIIVTTSKWIYESEKPDFYVDAAARPPEGEWWGSFPHWERLTHLSQPLLSSVIKLVPCLMSMESYIEQACQILNE